MNCYSCDKLLKTDKHGLLCPKCLARKWRSKNRVRALYLQLKFNAKRRGIEFVIQWHEWQWFCNSTNYHNLVGRRKTDMSVDRIDEAGIYCYSNIRMCTNSANKSKNARWLMKQKSKVDYSDVPF